MNTTPIDRITILPSRQRREHEPDAEQELIESIRTVGLLHPIVIRTEGDDLILVAGERRLRAIREIYQLGGTFRHSGSEYLDGLVPYTHLGDLSPIEAEEAELEENIRRVDLSWQDRAAAEARLLAFRDKQATIARAPLPKIPDIAKEAGSTALSISRSVVLARNLHRPEVQGAKSAADAMKALLRVEEQERNTEKAAALGKDFLGGKHRLYNWDCIEWMKQQPDAEYDVVCTDPPYGMGADDFGDSGGATGGAHTYSDNAEDVQEMLRDAIPQFSRLAKPDSHLYLFCDFDMFRWLKFQLEASGWRVFRTPLVWFKPSAFRAPWPDQGPQRKYELILYAVKGDLKTTKLGGDVLQYAPDGNVGHNAQKPVDLLRDLLSRSVRPGMKVLDPFCGSGPVFPAAHALSAIATGVELDPRYFAIAAERVSKLKEGKK